MRIGGGRHASDKEATKRDSDSAPKHAKVLSKPIHLREIVSEVERMIAA